jgi:hypothetical protein
MIEAVLIALVGQNTNWMLFFHLDTVLKANVRHTKTVVANMFLPFLYYTQGI